MKMKKRIFALFTAMVLLCGALTGCGPTGSSTTTPSGSGDADGAEAGQKDTLIVAVPESPTYMDPMVQASIATFRVTTQMFDRLVMLDYDMNLVPGLAESWDVVDETTTVFHLRKGVKFHNGEEMTSEDVKYSLERCMANPGVNYNYLIIESITCDDDYTVTIKTSEPFNALLPRLTLDAASIICKSADTSPEEFNKNPVGAGPYKFVSWELGGDVVLEAFEDYWGGAPAIKRIIFRTIPEALNRTIGLETGEVDLAYADTGEGAHDMYIMSKTSIDPDSMLRAMYHTEAFGPSGNRSFWATPEVDAMIDEASTTTDTEHAMELYAEIQRIVADAAPLVPLAVEHLNAGMQSNVKGFGLYPGKSHYINGTYFE